MDLGRVQTASNAHPCKTVKEDSATDATTEAAASNTLRPLCSPSESSKDFALRVVDHLEAISSEAVPTNPIDVADRCTSMYIKLSNPRRKSNKNGRSNSKRVQSKDRRQANSD